MDNKEWGLCSNSSRSWYLRVVTFFRSLALFGLPKMYIALNSSREQGREKYHLFESVDWHAKSRQLSFLGSTELLVLVEWMVSFLMRKSLSYLLYLWNHASLDLHGEKHLHPYAQVTSVCVAQARSFYVLSGCF